ncbi:MAG: formylglycine-generating enzyme family protein [Bacteroidales bacterium]|nr:formylglycine-generating enzyme family protein [Bacteroidales bacterium]
MSVIWYLFLTTNDAKRGANESIGFDVNGAKFTMKYVEGGRFMMGASASDTIAKTWEKPAHSVILDDYYIGETEVSQALWKAVMNNNPSKHVGDNYPVDCVSWDDCMDFCKKLSSITGYYFCLPTEAEWEFAARGGNKSNNYKYSGSNNLNEVAWCLDDSDTISHVVKTKKPNELGVYDMTGNVWEWCYDYWNNQYESYSGFSQINPHGTPSGEFRVHRGGAWHSSSKYCRVSYRWYAKAERHNDFRGFRLAMHLPRNQ